ncbi:MAG: gluconate 2-dehydrogenase subunit 3 family protein [Gemmatimonadota bacterium]|nr:gluconate 2-dehydrogenase subunit 3 family protein [Gemmatimonadota bacterium]
MSNNKTVSGLTPNQRSTLEAVCDTLLPEFTTENDRHGLFATGARSTGTADRVERLIGSIRDPQDRARVRLLLSVLGSSVANLALAGRFGAFSALDWEAREAVLRSWAHSRLPLRRAGEKVKSDVQELMKRLG